VVVNKNSVTIGIPVYNEQDRIEQAIRSAAPQCGRLIVADNASTDKTESICRSLQLSYPNMEYFRHATNLGSLENWHFLISNADTPYFMTLGSHDTIEAGFIDTLLETLSSDSAIALAAGGLFYNYEFDPSSVLRPDVGFNNWKGGIDPSPAQRVKSFLFADARLPWAMYGLFRTEVYKKCFTRDLPLDGLDLVFLAKIAQHGKVVINQHARYYAWVRSVEDTREKYAERISGSKENAKQLLKMKIARRTEIHKILTNSLQPKSFFARLKLRFEAMARFGPYKLPSSDPWFYLLFLPSKVVGEARRLKRRVGRRMGALS
jgi:glycosyltransferase involved in cell wall biosynthesis